MNKVTRYVVRENGMNGVMPVNEHYTGRDNQYVLEVHYENLERYSEAVDRLKLGLETDLDAALAREAALREELAESESVVGTVSTLLAGVAVALRGPEQALQRHGYHDIPARVIELQLRLTAAEQRNAVMSKLLQRCIPVCRYKGSHTERALINEIETALTNPTESGASDRNSKWEDTFGPDYEDDSE